MQKRWKSIGIAKDEIVINVQADEPFLEHSVIRTLQNLIKEQQPFMASLAKVIDEKQITDSNLVKVVCNAENEAIYFSRSVIPFCRDGACEALQNTPYLGHLGLYGFFAKTLEEFCSLPKSPLEEIEKLEQLRAIYHKKSICNGGCRRHKAWGLTRLKTIKKHCNIWHIMSDN